MLKIEAISDAARNLLRHINPRKYSTREDSGFDSQVVVAIPSEQLESRIIYASSVTMGASLPQHVSYIDCG